LIRDEIFNYLWSRFKDRNVVESFNGQLTINRMSLATLIICLLLSIVFGVAGVAKLLDLRGTREAVKNFGVREQFADAAKFLLPALEIAIAIGLLYPSAVWVSALGALLLLSMFVVVMAIKLQQGQTHDCHCFGQLYSRPLDWSSLARNFAFAIGAGWIVWQGGASSSVIARRLGLVPFEVIIVEFAILLLATGAAALVIMRRQRANAALLAKPMPRGLPIGSIAPPFELESYKRGRVSLSDLLAPGYPLMLIFSNPKCGPCASLFLELGEWRRASSTQITVAIISSGTIKDNFVNVARNSLENVLLQQDREVAAQYEAMVTPTAVIVGRDGTIATQIAAGADEIRQLFRSAIEVASAKDEVRLATV
jgi:uncharacterized membrane protein YphA (DoxX/SURF4 family)/peroxiredoxin